MLKVRLRKGLKESDFLRLVNEAKHPRERERILVLALVPITKKFQ